MSVVSLTQLKSYFENGDFPTEQNFIDLIDTLGKQNNLRTVAYTIGAPGVAGCDYNFTSVANTTRQNIQLGGTAIIPTNSPIPVITLKCTVGLSGVVTGTGDLGNTSGGTEYGSGISVDDTDEIANVTNNVAISSASSIYFGFTPSANWNTITTGQWKIWITYIDNSLL